MGTAIDLRLGSVVLCSNWNGPGLDYGSLFQTKDRTRLRSDQIDYDLIDVDDDEQTALAEGALVRSLKSTVPRLELLGYTVAAVEAHYVARATELFQLQLDRRVEGEPTKPLPLQFFEFIAFLNRHPIFALDDTCAQDFGPELLDRVSSRFRSDPAWDRIPRENYGDGYSEAGYFASIISFLDPCALLRLLALVELNLQLDIVWQYGPVVDSGWAAEKNFTPCARRDETFLIATEGSSDVHILNHAITLLMPEVADFFRFIDVSDRHPFSGTGSLVKFAEGLVKIDVQNRLLIVFDNDAEGWAAFEEVQKYKLPANMRTMVLPELDEFRQFRTLGPQGVVESDINRRAAAIECYLDLRLKGQPPAQVRWTNFKKESQDYQGSLEHKESYARAFFELNQQALAQETYDVTKLRAILNRICIECQKISSPTVNMF